MKRETCCFCGKEIKGYGNNPSPIKDVGRCCDECNRKVVLARILLSRYYSCNEGKNEIEELCKNNKPLIGSEVIIIEMKKEPIYKGRVGTITSIDDIGQLHGTWGGCALIPDVDVFLII